MTKLDLQERMFHGSVNGYEFDAQASGVLIAPRVPDIVRDEMRLQAADAFLSSARAVRLEPEEFRYWGGIRTLDNGHKFFVEKEKRGMRRTEEVSS